MLILWSLGIFLEGSQLISNLFFPKDILNDETTRQYL